jgi:hypothetical protein
MEFDLLVGSVKLVAQDAARQKRRGRPGFRASGLRLTFVCTLHESSSVRIGSDGLGGKQGPVIPVAEIPLQ